MKKIIFLAHDPGGIDVIVPVYQSFPENIGLEKEFWAIGPAGKKYPEHQVDKVAVKEKLMNLLEMDKVLCMVSGTSWGDKTELCCLETCRAYGIKTIIILDYWSNYIKRLQLSEGEFFFPDAYLVMDDLAKREAVAEGIPEDIIHIVGRPGMEKYIHKIFDNGRDHPEMENKVLFLSQPLSVLYGNSLGYNEFTVLEDLRCICDELSLDLSIKFHPKDSDVFVSANRDIGIKGELSDVMMKCDWVIGMSSVALLYAALMDISVISYQPNLKGKDMSIINRLHLGHMVFSKCELKRVLQRNAHEKKTSLIPEFAVNPIQRTLSQIILMINF